MEIRTCLNWLILKIYLVQLVSYRISRYSHSKQHPVCYIKFNYTKFRIFHRLIPFCLMWLSHLKVFDFFFSVICRWWWLDFSIHKLTSIWFHFYCTMVHYFYWTYFDNYILFSKKLIAFGVSIGNEKTINSML